MKKILSFLIVFAMILPLAACGKEEPEKPAVMGDGLNVGFAKVDITPDYTVGLGGYADSETRKSNEIADRIYATCLAFTEEKQTVLVYTVDTCAIDAGNAEYFRVLITANTGVPDSQIFFGATHGHSCPSITGQYRTDLTQWLVEAGRKAMLDRSPATMLAATPEIKGMNFVRHYEMADGTYAGSNFGDFSKKIVGHATESDPRAVILKFDREEGRKDILMVNWQAHPDSAGDIGYNNISASWVGYLRDELEKRSGAHVAYFTGASGNQNQSSKIWTEKHFLSWKNYGKKMGKLLNKELKHLQPVDTTGIKTRRLMFSAKVDHSWDPMLEQANQVYDLWKTSGKADGDALGKTYGFTSVYQASAIRRRANMGQSLPLEINVFSVGGVGFTVGTYEMFSDQGLYVKNNSPFAVTFLITGNSGYIPSEKAYEYRSYESDTGTFVAGTAEELAETYVELLNTLKEET